MEGQFGATMDFAKGLNSRLFLLHTLTVPRMNSNIATVTHFRTSLVHVSFSLQDSYALFIFALPVPISAWHNG